MNLNVFIAIGDFTTEFAGDRFKYAWGIREAIVLKERKKKKKCVCVYVHEISNINISYFLLPIFIEALFAPNLQMYNPSSEQMEIYEKNI